MKNIHRIFLAFFIALGVSNAAGAMNNSFFNISSLLNTLKVNLPSWKSRGPLEQPEMEQGKIDKAIKELEQKYIEFAQHGQTFKETTNDLFLAAVKNTSTPEGQNLLNLQRTTNDTGLERFQNLLFGIKVPEKLIENDEHRQKALEALQTNPIYTELLNNTTKLQEGIQDNQKIIACLEKHKHATKDLCDFLGDNQEKIEKIAWRNLYDDSESNKQIARELVANLKKYNNELPACIKNVNNAETFSYQDLIVNTPGLETAQEALESVKQKIEQNEKIEAEKKLNETEKIRIDQEAAAKETENKANEEKIKIENTRIAEEKFNKNFDETKNSYNQAHDNLHTKTKQLIKGGGNQTLIDEAFKAFDTTKFNEKCWPASNTNTTRADCLEFMQNELENLNALDQQLSKELEQLVNYQNSSLLRKFIINANGFMYRSKTRADKACSRFSGNNNDTCFEIAQGYWNRFSQLHWTAPYFAYTLSGISALYLAVKCIYPALTIQQFGKTLLGLGFIVGFIAGSYYGVVTFWPQLPTTLLEKLPTESLAQFWNSTVSFFCQYQNGNITNITINQ